MSEDLVEGRKIWWRMFAAEWLREERCFCLRELWFEARGVRLGSSLNNVRDKNEHPALVIDALSQRGGLDGLWIHIPSFFTSSLWINVFLFLFRQLN